MSAEPASSGNRWANHALRLALMLIPFFLLTIRHSGWSPPAEAGDYAQYLAHTRAIAEGRPYGDIGYITHPAAWTIGPAAFPAGLPLTLAPLVAVGGVHTPAIRVLMVGTVALMAVLAYLRLSRDVAPWAAAFGAGAAAFAIEARYGTLAPISDPGFAALLWALILAVDDSREWSWRRVALVTLLGFAAIAYRIAAVAIVPALALFAIIRWRQHRGRALIPAALWSVAGLAVVLRGAAGGSYGGRPLDVLNLIVNRFDVMVRSYRYALFDVELAPFADRGLDRGWHLIASVLVVVGLVAIVRRVRLGFLTVVTVAYLGLLALSPVADARYLWPLFPILATALAVGMEVAVGRPVVRLTRTSSPAYAAAAVLALVLIGATVAELRKGPPRAFVGAPDTNALFDWLRAAQARSPMRLAFDNPRVVTLETGVPAMGLAQRSASGQLIAFDERQVTHLIWQRDDASTCVQRIANRLPAEFQGRFALDYENPTFRVYRLIPGIGPAAGAFETIRWRERERWCGPAAASSSSGTRR